MFIQILNYYHVCIVKGMYVDLPNMWRHGTGGDEQIFILFSNLQTTGQFRRS